jgi:hypothetical protein
MEAISPAENVSGSPLPSAAKVFSLKITSF